MNDWKTELAFFDSNKYKELEDFLEQERAEGKSILPSEDDVFNALEYTPLEDVKVVIVGQDPYPNKRHAHGLAFSIPKETEDIPKSLKNILKELESDIGATASSGNLVSWAKQGVLLLNRVLTVEEGNANSHRRKGWEVLTEEIIRLVSNKRHNIVFILWGRNAQECEKFIEKDNHLVIKSPHPSPLAAYRGFFDSKPFSKTNNFLNQNGIKPIDWSI